MFNGDSPKRKRNVLYELSLQAHGANGFVCKIMFLRILGLKTDGMITDLLNAHSADSVGSTVKLVTDNRGRKIPSNKSDSSLIVDHIESYHPQIQCKSLQPGTCTKQAIS